MPLVHRRLVMTADRIDRALERIGYEILERCPDPSSIALIGIRNGGVNPTLRIAHYLKKIEGLEIPIGMLDITLYRDDISANNKPLIKKTEIDFDLEGKWLVLVDDVLFTGRTLRAALDAVMGYGRPSCVRAAILVDRGHRELPIQPDFVGQVLDTDRHEKVDVTIGEAKGRNDKVVVVSEVQPVEAPE